MALIETWLRCELGSAVQVQYLNGNLFSQDNQANLIGVRVYENGEPASLSGSVSANVIRADGGTVAVAGTLQNGNECYVILPQSAYAVPGAVSVIIKITSSGQVTTLAAAVSTVYTSSTETAIDPGTIIPSVQTLISAIETAVASIPADYSSLWTSLAPAYSTSSTYAVGSYVTYNGGLYRCTTAITSGESWTSGHWTAAKLGPDVSDLKSALDAVNKDEMDGYRHVHKWVNGTWSGITLNTNTKRVRPESWIYVKAGDIVSITNGSYVHGVGLYKGTLDSYTLVRNDNSWITTDETFTVADNGFFIAAFANASDQTAVINPDDFNGNVLITSYSMRMKKETDSKIGNTEADIAFQAYNEVTHHAITDGTVFAVFERGAMNFPQNIGDVVDITERDGLETWACSVIDCIAGDKFICTLTGGGAAAGGGKRAWAFLDVDKKILSAASRNATLTDSEITAPTNAKYLAVNSKTANTQYYVCKKESFNSKVLSSNADIAKEISGGDDLNTYISPGTYCCSIGSIAANVSNSPYSNVGYILYVIKSTTNERYAQLAIPNSVLLRIAYRMNTGTWGDWNYLANTTDEDTIKPYIKNEAIIVSDKVRSVQDGKTLTMSGISDLHLRLDNTTIVSAIEDMSHALAEIRKKIFTDYDVCYGDTGYVYTGYTDFDNNKAAYSEVTKQISECFSETKQIRLVGNHDMNSVDSPDHFTMDEIYGYFGMFNMPVEKPETYRNRGYGFIDDEYRKIRIICLNTSDFGNGTPPANNNNYYMSAEQIEWFVGKLDLTEKQDAENWQIILMAHMSFDQPTMVNNGYAEIINAYETGGSGTLKGVSYNFSGKNTAKLALFIHGHTHSFIVDNHHHKDSNDYPRMKLARICIPNALPGREVDAQAIDTNGIDWGTGEVYTKTSDTADSTSFVVNTIDPVNKIIYSHCYGAGIDRILHYDSIKVIGTHTITGGKLTPSSWETMDSEIATVSSGVVTAVASGNVLVYAKDVNGNREYWNINV